MLNFLGTSLFVLFSTTSLVTLAAQVNEAQESVEKVDLIKIHESLKPVRYSGAKQSDLAPDSKVVEIHFDKEKEKEKEREKEAFNHYSSDSININKTKQSQDFDVQSRPDDPTSSTTAKPIEVVSEVTTVISIISQPSINDDQQPSSTTTSPTIDPLQPSTQEPEAPVASKTTRHGSAVFCGEANPNGKSNKKLVLDRIVGGRKTEPGEFPFQVRLNIRSRRGSGICGGVILDEKHILTAAHCMTACVSQYLTTATIENTGVHATIGDHSIRANDGEVEIDVAKITPHEKYDACNFYANDHDIAVITTDKPIEYKFTSDGYGSINRPCMPRSQELTYKEGESVIVSGWGVTRENSGSLSNILRYVQVPVVNISRCQETYGSRVTSDHVCAGYQSGGKDSCQGDSGGPLVRVVDNRYELVGIVSFGYGCGQPGAPGVYTRVASYIDWIKANL